MKPIRIRMFPAVLSCIVLALLAGPGLVSGQQQAAPPAVGGGWRHFGEPSQAQPATPNDPEPMARAEAQDPAPAADPPAVPAADPPRAAQPYQLPAELTVKPGTYVTIRVNEMLSSDRNHAGDSFSGVLTQPLVVDGIVVAEHGQTVYGRVAEAEKAHSNTPSRLALELTELSLADGTQTPIRSEMTTRQGGTVPGGAQANTVVGTTLLGAVIGSAVGWGTGAAIGAGVGAAAGAAAVMQTRNRPTFIYPETALTFRIDSPVLVSTVRAPQAFRFAGPADYNRPVQAELTPRPPAGRPVGPVWGSPYPYPSPYYASPYPYPYMYSYPPYWSPYYGPGLGVGIAIGRGGYGRWR
ncbi:MAG: hypothetical protein ABSF25_18275 [Bryobacteraceae bacterium]|jgi:hypothetical protein